MIAATYISSSQFSISGEHDQEFEYGRSITFLQGGSGSVDAKATLAAYNSEENKTVITVVPAVIQASLVAITRGATSGKSGGAHDHSGWNSGGPIPAAALSAANTTKLLNLTALTGNYGDVIQLDDAGALSMDSPGLIKSKLAGESLTAYQVVYQDTADSGKLKVATNAGTLAEADAVGIVLGSASIDQAVYAKLAGEIYRLAWTFTPGAILWLDVDGGITETEPVSGYKTRLGKAWDAHTIILNIQPPTAA